MTSLLRLGSRGLAALLAVLIMAMLGSAPFQVSAASTRAAAVAVALTTQGSPFDPDGDGKRERVTARLELAHSARVRLSVHDFNGRQLRTLAPDAELVAGTYEWRWDGRDQRGRLMPYGPYRIRARITSAEGAVTWRARWVTRSARIPYPVNPGAIVVALDPGHGGPASGAVWHGLSEDRVNLDIGLRLEAMLQGAGIGVVMTRRRDRNVSPVGLDLTGDRRYTRTDELIARNDIANRAGADIHIAIHNDANDCRCARGTTMFTHFRRSWSPEGRKLAKLVLKAHLRHLRRLPGYRPFDRGVKSYPFKALKPYDRRAMPRPSLQPSILGESLFIDRSVEHDILATKRGRGVIAAAYFDGIARYLASRRYGLRYEITQVPRHVPLGTAAAVTVRITNRGRTTSSGWRIKARVVRSVLRYDGRPRRGRIAARVAIPDGLAPGESVELTVPDIGMPAKKGTWLVKLDVDLPGGDHMSTHGVVGPQVRVRTVAP